MTRSSLKSKPYKVRQSDIQFGFQATQVSGLIVVNSTLHSVMSPRCFVLHNMVSDKLTLHCLLAEAILHFLDSTSLTRYPAECLLGHRRWQPGRRREPEHSPEGGRGGEGEEEECQVMSALPYWNRGWSVFFCCSSWPVGMLSCVWALLFPEMTLIRWRNWNLRARMGISR